VRGVWFHDRPFPATKLADEVVRPVAPTSPAAGKISGVCSSGTPAPARRHAETKTPAPRIQTSATSLRAAQLLTSRPLQPLLGQQRPDGHRAGASWTALEGSANVSHAAVRNQLRSANLTAPLPPQARLFTVTVCPTYYRSRRSPTHHRIADGTCLLLRLLRNNRARVVDEADLRGAERGRRR